MKSVRRYFILIIKITFCLLVFQAGTAKSAEVNVYSHRHYEADDALYAMEIIAAENNIMIFVN